jgi:hypothetical protein
MHKKCDIITEKDKRKFWIHFEFTVLNPDIEVSGS